MGGGRAWAVARGVSGRLAWAGWRGRLGGGWVAVGWRERLAWRVRTWAVARGMGGGWVAWVVRRAGGCGRGVWGAYALYPKPLPDCSRCEVWVSGGRLGDGCWRGVVARAGGRLAVRWV